MSAPAEQLNTTPQKVEKKSIAIPAANSGFQGAFSSAANFEAAQRMAMALTSSDMVPEQYRGRDNVGNAIIALELSQRINASPLLVMQNLYMVHGNPGWSAKFLIATFNQCGRFSAIKYEWKDGIDESSPDFGCRAYAIEKKTGDKIIGPWITWRLVKAEKWDGKNGSKWKTMPEKMFQYRAAAWMIDTNAPEISMGIPTSDQLHDVYDVDPITGEVLNPVHSQATAPSSRTASLSEKIKQKADNEIIEGEAEPTKTDAPTFSYAEIADKINTATSVDAIEEALDMSNSLPKNQQEEIQVAADLKLKEMEQSK